MMLYPGARGHYHPASFTGRTDRHVILSPRCSPIPRSRSGRCAGAREGAAAGPCPIGQLPTAR